MADPYPQIAAKYEPLIRDALNRAWERVRRTATLAELTEAIQTGGAVGVLRYLDSIDDDVARELVPVLESAITESGRALVEILPRGTASQVAVFSLTEPNTAQYLREYTMTMIREITAETREAVRQAVQAGVIAGRNPRSIAYDFRAAVGLTAEREQTVQRFRQALKDRDVAYVASLSTADKRMIQLADTGRLNQRSIDDAVNRLRLRYVAQRGETIARTESMRAISVGQHLSIEQSGLSDELEKRWVARRGDGRTRNAHLEIDGMNGWIPYAAEFRTPLGPLQFPRDPNGTAANTINCRCRMQIQVRGPGG